MAEQPKPQHTATPNDSDEKPSSLTRRRWLQAGLSASPVLMTVISRPVLAAAQCVPPSAYVSLGASAPGMYAACGGNGPKTWSDPSTVWPLTYSRETSLFNPVFAPPGFSLPSPDGPTLLAVLQDSTYNDVAKYVVAALLNSADPSSPLVPTSILSLAAIKHIWTESVGGVGSFTPSPGASWGPAEIVDYLKSTMTSPS